MPYPLFFPHMFCAMVAQGELDQLIRRLRLPLDALERRGRLLRRVSQRLKGQQRLTQRVLCGRVGLDGKGRVIQSRRAGKRILRQLVLELQTDALRRFLADARRAGPALRHPR